MCASRYEVLDPVREVFSLNLLSMVEPLHNDMPVSTLLQLLLVLLVGKRLCIQVGFGYKFLS
jgi:hypothetical protein